MGSMKNRKIPEALKGKLLEPVELGTRYDDLVRFAIKNQWDLPTLQEWIKVSWLDIKGSDTQPHLEKL